MYIYMLSILSSFIYILSPSTFDSKDLDFLLINSLLVECITQYQHEIFPRLFNKHHDVLNLNVERSSKLTFILEMTLNDMCSIA